MKRIRAIVLVGTLLTSGVGIAYAQRFELDFPAYRNGDYATALRLFRPIAEGGNVKAQIAIGMMYAAGKGVPQDYKEAAKWFRLAADKGNAEAQAFLGGILSDGGSGVDQDLKEATKWLSLAARQGNASAQEGLGNIFYSGGINVAQNYAEAIKWYRQAADQGNADSQLRLGYMYYNAQGVTQDYKEAIKWYRQSAENGNADAQFFLGNMYNQGKGVTQDYREAVKWHRLAAQQGMAKAQLALSINYYGGKEGVAQDYTYAYMWASLAASKLDGVLGEAAARQRNGVAKEMTSAQVLAAQEMARMCEESDYKQCGKLENTEAEKTLVLVPMQREGGVYVVPVLINNAITLNFVVDTGASDVSIPADVVTTLMRTGTLKTADFQGEQKYRLADGTTVPSQTFRIRSLKVGGKIVENLNGSVTSVNGALLLGQSFLSRFKSWSIDNARHALVLE